MLTDNQRDELLIRLDERVAKIREDQKELKKTTASKERVEKIENSQRWTRRTVWGALIGLLVKLGWDAFATA
jgi:hypothetical protein